MVNVLLTTCLLVLAQPGGTWCKERCCHHVGCFTNEYPFNALPLPKCEDVIQASMRLYTRSNPNLAQIITRSTIPPALMEGKRVVFVTHGYLNWNNIWWLKDFKDALLRAYDYNVVLATWPGGAINIDYTQAASNTRVAGAEIGLVARHLVERGVVARHQLWCVGHSLGSHVCGHAGQTYKFGKVTGLDPAGPWFEDKDWTIGINPSVADFVDIWHTNGDSELLTAFGTLKRLGHVDFYPNGGGFQPGCIFDPYANTTSLHYLSQKFDDLMPFCSHLRALDLFEEAINSECQMYSTHFCNDESNIPNMASSELLPTPLVVVFADRQRDGGGNSLLALFGTLSCFDCEGGRCGVMGMDSHLWDVDDLTNRQYMRTDSRVPFCRNTPSRMFSTHNNNNMHTT